MTDMNEINEVSENNTVVEPENKPESKTFTQEELDKIVADRISREKKKLDKFADYDDLKSKLTEFETKETERKKAEMSEAERLQAEKEEAEKRAKEYENRATEALQKANQRLIKSEFKLLAKEIGIRSDALEDAFVLADLKSVEVDDEGGISGVQEALDALKSNKAYLFEVKQNFADPSPGNKEPKRDGKENVKQKLAALEQQAKKTGRIEDRMAYSNLKRELGL